MKVQTIGVAPATEPDLDTSRPKAIGLVRYDISGLDAPRHATAIRRHACTLGYEYVYTARPSRDASDPVGYALALATGLHAAAIIVYDLAHVDNQPSRVCEKFDLETVCPETTWARTAHPHSTKPGAA
jgi:hypothetical protein